MEIDTDFSHLEFVLAWFFIYFPWGRNGVKGAANGIAWVIESAHKGTDSRSLVSLLKADGYGY